MEMSKSLFLFLLFKSCLSQELGPTFKNINKETGKFNAIAADIAWESSINPGNPELPRKSATYQRNRIVWQDRTCNKLGSLYVRQLLNDTQRRQSYLLCRGPKFTFDEARLTSNLYEELQSTYADAEIFIPSETKTSKTNMAEIENAILNYLSNVKKFSNRGQDHILYAAKIALKSDGKGKKNVCLKGEDDFDKLMRFSKSENVLRWLWLVWREKVGPPMKEPYRRLVNVENQAVRRNGYPNIGASWRDELEMPRLRQQCRGLYNTVKRLYSLLHGVTRYYLRRRYGDMVPINGPIPGHLLGNLWAHNWESLSDLMLPVNIDLDKTIKELNWTVEHMVKRAEDFYQSLGLPAMTDKFWRESVFTRKNKNERCHGTAADMFQDDDYRLLYCSNVSKEDFYVLHHELGHIHYYMAYEHQPALYRQANAALHETIGDTIMYGVLTPQHLHRLGLINDSLLYSTNNVQNIPDNLNNVISKPNQKPKKVADMKNNDEILTDEINTSAPSDVKDTKKAKTVKGSNIFIKFNKAFQRIKRKPELFDPKDLTIDMILLLKQALNKIPQIPFALVVDEYRWRYFEGSLDKGNENKEFWNLVEELQGVIPVGRRGEEYFDVGAKFHVPDNTPYIRYFLSSFLQHQLFEKLCKSAVFGQRNTDNSIPDSIGLGRCDIYGSKAAGKVLKDLMSRGHSQHWSEILQDIINEPKISAAPLIRYYQPLTDLMEKFVRKHRIPVGW